MALQAGASRAILLAVEQLRNDVLSSDAQLNAAAAALLRGGGAVAAYSFFTGGGGGLPSGTGGAAGAPASSLFRATVSALQSSTVPLIAAVPPSVAPAVPGGPVRRLWVRRDAPADVVRQRVLEAFGLGDPRVDVAFEFRAGEAGAAHPAGVTLPLGMQASGEVGAAAHPAAPGSSYTPSHHSRSSAAQGVLEEAHRVREARGLLELPVVVFDAAVGIGGAPAAAAAAPPALFHAFAVPPPPPAPPVLRPALSIPSVDLSDESGRAGDSPMPGRASATAEATAVAALPPYTAAVAGLRAKYGDAIVVNEGVVQRLHALFAEKAAAAAAAGAAGAHASQLSHGEFVGFMGAAAGTPPEVAGLMFAAMDGDGSGAVSFEEMVVGFAVMAAGDLRTRLGLALRAFDVDKSGAKGEEGGRLQEARTSAPPHRRREDQLRGDAVARAVLDGPRSSRERRARGPPRRRLRHERRRRARRRRAVRRRAGQPAAPGRLPVGGAVERAAVHAPAARPPSRQAPCTGNTGNFALAAAARPRRNPADHDGGSVQ